MRGLQLSAALCAAALLAGGWGAGKKEAAERVVKVVVMQPVKMEFVQKIRVQGNVETKAKAEVSSRISGTLDLMKADEGQRVRKGDILFQVDRIKLENDVKGQKHKLAVAEAELKIAVINSELARTVADKAQVDFNRADQLRKANAVSDDAYERAALNLKEAEAGVSKAEAQANYARAKVGQEQANLEIAEKNLSDSLIRAPFDGMVILKKKDPDEFVNTGDIIYRLENPDRLELVTMISAVYYDRIIPGKTRAVIYAPNGSVAGEGTVGFRSPAIDSLSRTFTVKIDIPKEFHMVSGQLCELDLILRREEGVGVPNQALLDRRDNRRAVFVVRDGRAEEVEVKTGIVDGKWTMLLNPRGAEGIAGRRRRAGVSRQRRPGRHRAGGEGGEINVSFPRFRPAPDRDELFPHHARVVRNQFLGPARARRVPERRDSVCDGHDGLSGASPAEIEVDVAKRLEDAVGTIDGLKTMNTTCMENVCQITLEFQLGQSVDVAAQDVRERIDKIRKELPADIEQPGNFEVRPERNAGHHPHADRGSAGRQAL